MLLKIVIIITISIICTQAFVVRHHQQHHKVPVTTPTIIITTTYDSLKKSSSPPFLIKNQQRESPSLSSVVSRCCSSRNSIRTTALLLQQQQDSNNNEGGGGWSIIDDWNTLSNENPNNVGISNTNQIYNQDIVHSAAIKFLYTDGQQEQLVSKEDQVMEDTILQIYTEEEVDEVNQDDVEQKQQGNNIHFEETMSREIALLIRCNENPNQLNIQQGRDIPELTEQELYDVRQLLQPVVLGSDDHDGQQQKQVIIEPTIFLKEVIHSIIEYHGTYINGDKDYKVLDANGIGKWIQKSNDETKMVGPHDHRVKHMIAKYGTYGTNYLTEIELLHFYIQTLIGNDDDNNGCTCIEKIEKYRKQEIQNVWRDIYNHDIISPNELQRTIKLAEIGLSDANNNNSSNGQQMANKYTILDECELIYDNDDGYTTAATVGGNNPNGISSTTDRQGKSSHELVQVVASTAAGQQKATTIRQQNTDKDKTSVTMKKKMNIAGGESSTSSSVVGTPLYIKDGDFVFIDEETCIGCMQCVTAAPGSFKMLENGRARTYYQRSATKDVKAAVNACPVDCMHYVSFDELTELEIARDVGLDDNSHHKHFGHSSSRGYIPRVPLHVSRRDSDANHRESFYHFIKNKCFKSSDCPQRGCYDCPRYRSDPDSNPYFQARVKEAQHARAQYFIQTGLADQYRKTADL